MNHQVKWVFLDNTPRTLSYQVTPPVGSVGVVQFSGIVDFDGTDFTVLGDDAIGVMPLRPIIGTGSVSAVTSCNAFITCPINPNGIAPTVFFQYGTTASYTSTTSSQYLASGTTSVPITIQATGLHPATEYHYRMVAAYSGGLSYGTDQVFVTTNSPTTEIIAFRSDAAPGIAGAAFDGFGGFAINDYGHVAFRAAVSGSGVTSLNSQGIWADYSGTSQLAARTGDPAPGVSSGIFATLGDPVYNNRDQVAFIGTLQNVGSVTTLSSTGIWCRGTNGVLSLVARTRTPVSGRPIFNAFRKLALPRQTGVIFLADLTHVSGVTSTNDQGIWAVNSSNRLQQVVRKGERVTVGATQKTITSFSALASPAADGGQARSFNGSGTVLCTVAFSDGTQGVMRILPSLATSVLLQQRTAAPGVPGAQFSWFYNPAINDRNHSAFRGLLGGSGITSSNNYGIWADRGSTRQLIARTGASARGITRGIFAGLSEPVYDNLDRVAFLGTLKVGSGVTTANATGIWSTGTSGVLSLVTRAQAQAPGCPAGAKFAAFNQFVLPDRGGVMFLGTLTAGSGGVAGANAQGVWAVDTLGRLKLVVRTGDTLNIDGDVKTISTLTIFSPGVQSSHFNRSGGIIYRATFTDGTQGLIAVFPE